MTLFALDTDTVTLLRQADPNVLAQVAVRQPGEVKTTVITIEEQLTGWYNRLRRVRRPDQIEFVYAQLAQTVVALARLPLLPYTQTAIARYNQLVAQKLNVGKNDLRVAAIALEHGAIVVTRNVRDFGRVPNLTVEDWSTPPTAPTAAGS